MPRHVLPSALLLAGALTACSQRDATPKAPQANAPAATQLSTPATDSLVKAADRGRVLGAESASVWLLVVSDFQCPWCKRWHDETFPALKRDYVETGKLRIAYLNFPLGMHANAWPSATAAMCASAQGKFWETHDRIFATQKTWETLADATKFLDSLAVAAGADAARQAACSHSTALKPLIDADQDRARKAGAESTPTFFVGQVPIIGADSLAKFRRVIDAALKAAGK